MEALDLQAETKFYVYKLSHIEFQALEINYITIWMLQQVKFITSCTDVTLNAFSSSNYASIIYSDLNSPTLCWENNFIVVKI